MSRTAARRCWRRCLVGVSLVGVSLGAALACDSRRPLESRGAPPASLGFSRPPPATAEPSPDTSVSRPQRAGAARDEPLQPGELAGSNAADATEAQGSVLDPFIIDSLVDVAAAGPVTATELGISMFNRDNRLQLARLSGPLEPGTEPRETRLEPLPDAAGPFPLARGPAVRRGLAYWVSRGRLLGQSLASAGSGTALVLSEDARVGTRVAVPVGSARELQDVPQVAAYVARPTDPEGPPTAKLWVEGQLTRVALNDDLSSSHSVALAATSRGLSAVLLEARTGMSTVHVRQITFSRKREPRLGDDHIVWVGGPARPTTELFALAPDAVTIEAFVALERDITHFGLVGLDISLERSTPLPAEPDWLLYENGIEPAPFALASVCGRSIVALARPSSAVPHAPQELVLVDLARERRARAVIVARSRAFFDVSLVGLSGGALLGYVADHRTWARSIRCLRP